MSSPEELSFIDPLPLAQSSPAGLAWYAGLDPKTGTSSYALPPHLALLNRYIQRLAARELLLEGYRGIIASMPPRHGKSMLCSQYTPAWYLGLFPDHSIGLASYEANFAAEWGRKARGVLEQHGPQVFGIKLDWRSSAADRWKVVRTRGAPVDGGMVTTGIGGPLTGRGANLLIIDDPIKNAAEAHSRTRRDAIWEWWRTTAVTRLEPDGVVLIIMTRWHEDDLVGRLLDNQTEGERWLEVCLPAVAQEGDTLGRAVGEPLWSERFDLPVLQARQAELGSYIWNAMYQQQPAGFEGSMFERDSFVIMTEAPGKVHSVVRRWDTAATEEAGDYTVGVRMERLVDGRVCVTDVRRGRWSAEEVEQQMLATAREDGHDVKIRMAEERGSAGKILSSRYKRLLQGYSFRGERETGDKELRARPYAAAVERGDVLVLSAPWTSEFLTEHALFPRGTNDDQVDAAASAFDDLQKARGGPVSW